MSEKCFCHLNGYKVKDSDARKSIEEIKKSMSETNYGNTENFTSLQESIANNELSIQQNANEIVDANVIIADNNFKTTAMILFNTNNLDMIVIENYDVSTDIDETKDDGNYVIVNNYNSKLHKIEIPSGNIKMIRSKAINVDFITKKFFIHIEKEGSGTIEAYFSSNNGVTFNSVEQDTLIDCAQGKQLVVQLKLTGEITLKNLCWGVRF